MKNKSLTKADIAQAVYDKIGYDKKFSQKLVTDLFNNIKNHLIKGRGVKIHGFGKFVLKDKKQRAGRNPQTGKKLIIRARRVLRFYVGSAFKKKF